MKEKFRELIDIPDKIAIVIGAYGLLLATIYPPALGPSLLLIIVGGSSLGITQGIWPKKQRTV